MIKNCNRQMSYKKNNAHDKTILWWGRFDPNYSRNRIIRQQLDALGCHIIDFHPRISALADIEARLRCIGKPDLVWVPCFRQRDINAASRWARAHGLPLVFDPLISAWDKQVFERQKFTTHSKAAHKLLQQERDQFQRADILVADTAQHARFFSETFTYDLQRIHVIPVGAEEALFRPQTIPADRGSPIEVLFYGSFIDLQAPQIIIEAARYCHDLPVRWHLLGKGPLLEQCKNAAQPLDNCVFEDWIEYTQLPQRIHRADILLGVFGASDKAGRVIPNKVYQAIACARTVVTRDSAAYPEAIAEGQSSGIYQIAADDAESLAQTVVSLAQDRQRIRQAGLNARKTYDQYFSNVMIRQKLEILLQII